MYSIEDFKDARDAFAGRLMMKKQDGDLSDSFRRRNDAIALKAINAVLLMFEIKAERMQAYQCKTCGNELMVDDDTHFCPFCGRAIR